MMGVPGLIERDDIPSGLLDVPATSLHEVVSPCTLIHLPGQRAEPLFVGVLLHGNETTGLQAVQQLLRKHQGRPLPRALSLFIGNVEAARHGVRRLPGQPDYNRIWPGTELADSPETRVARNVVWAMAARGAVACVDIHNNTGLNPHYACVERLDNRTLQLAALFSRLCIHATRPTGTCAAGFSKQCPAATLECGKPGTEFGAEHALEFLDACMRLDHLPDHAPAAHDLELYESVAQICVPAHVEFGFDEDGHELNLIPDLDRLNFTPVPAGFAWGRVGGDSIPLSVLNGHGEDVACRYFKVESGELRLRLPVMPSMLTLDRQAVRLDCLGYLMERRALPTDGNDEASGRGSA